MDKFDMAEKQWDTYCVRLIHLRNIPMREEFQLKVRFKTLSQLKRCRFVEEVTCVFMCWRLQTWRVQWNICWCCCTVMCIVMCWRLLTWQVQWNICWCCCKVMWIRPGGDLTFSKVTSEISSITLQKVTWPNHMFFSLTTTKKT